MPKWLEKFLEKLAKANKEQFGDTRKMDCCSVNMNNRKTGQYKNKKRSG